MTTKKSPTVRKRKPLTKQMRSKRARTAADARWKNKWQLEPGQPAPWSQRSLANREKIMAAATKGGRTTSARLRRQQDLFWRWFHGNCTDGLEGQLKRIAETFDELEAFHDTHHSDKLFAWEAFIHYVLSQFAVVPCWTKQPAEIERQMRSQYERLVKAELGDSIFSAYVDYEAAREEERQLKKAYRSLAKKKS